MKTVTVYIQDDRERKRRKKKRNVVALLLATGIAIVALGDRKTPVVQVAQPGPSAGPQVIEKTAYVDRPILAYADPVGPPAPPAAAPPEAPAQPVVRPPATRRPPGRRDPVPAKVQPPTPPPVATATVAPPPPPPPALQVAPLRLLIEPRQIHFARSGRQRVTITNPHPVAIVIHRIELGSADGASIAGYELDDAENCIKSLKPRQRCRFNVVSKGAVGGVSVRLHYTPAVVVTR